MARWLESPEPFLKGATMKSRAFMILSSAGVLFAVLFVVGANPSGRAAPQWEYGIYTESSGTYEWQDGSQRIQTTNPNQFFERMDFPIGVEVDTRTGFPTGLEASVRTGRIRVLVLNHLGRQGWELIDSDGTEARHAYWFKRPG